MLTRSQGLGSILSLYILKCKPSSLQFILQAYISSAVERNFSAPSEGLREGICKCPTHLAGWTGDCYYDSSSGHVSPFAYRERSQEQRRVCVCECVRCACKRAAICACAVLCHRLTCSRPNQLFSCALTWSTRKQGAVMHKKNFTCCYSKSQNQLSKACAKCITLLAAKPARKLPRRASVLG